MKIRCMGCMEEYDSYFEICPLCGMMKKPMRHHGFGLRPETILNQKYMAGVLLDCDDSTTTYIGYDLMNLRKVILNEYEALPEIAPQFFRMRIPGLFQVYDIFSQGAKWYVVTEYASGIALGQRMIAEGKMSMERALEFMMPVMEILNRMHSRGMYHLRVNPNAIFLTENGEVKLMVPGVYQSVIGSHRRKNVLSEESFYMAPEVKEAKRSEREKSDVYSVCAVFYKILTGEVPVKGAVREWEEALDVSKKRGEILSESRKNILMNGLLFRQDAETGSMKKLIWQFSSIRTIKREGQTEKASEEKKREDTREELCGYHQEGETHMEEGKKIKRKREERLPMTLGFFLVCGIVIVAVTRFWWSGQTKNVGKKITQEAFSSYVPNLIGSNYERAKKEADIEIMDRLNDEKKAGDILKQVPEPGTVLQENQKINVIVSAGSQKVSLKEAVGMVRGRDKEEKMEEAGFLIKKEEVESNILPGYVVSVEREERGEIPRKIVLSDAEYADYEIPAGCSIMVEISSGTERVDNRDVSLPPAEKLLGESFESVLEQAEKNNFYVGLCEETEYSLEIPAGKVCGIKKIKSRPKIDYKDAVLVTLSRGLRSFHVSACRGEVEQKVEQMLKKYNIKIEKKREYSNVDAPGTVMKAYANCKHKTDEVEKWGEGEVHWGDEVTLVVSRGSEPKTARKIETIPQKPSGNSAEPQKEGGRKKQNQRSHKKNPSRPDALKDR